MKFCLFGKNHVRCHVCDMTNFVSSLKQTGSTHGVALTSRRSDATRKYQSGSKVPVVVIVPGMDGYKEKYVSLYAVSSDNQGERSATIRMRMAPGLV